MWPYIIGAAIGGIIVVVGIWLAIVTSTTYH